MENRHEETDTSIGRSGGKECTDQQQYGTGGGEGGGVNSRSRRWAVGVARVTPTTLWASLEDTLTSLTLHHWEALSR